LLFLIIARFGFGICHHCPYLNLVPNLGQTLETIPDNITKQTDKTNFVSSSPQFMINVVNNAETTFGNIL
jgi:hypothetical protein